MLSAVVKLHGYGVRPVPFLVDTGADTTILSFQDAKEIGLEVTLLKRAPTPAKGMGGTLSLHLVEATLLFCKRTDAENLRDGNRHTCRELWPAFALGARHPERMVDEIPRSWSWWGRQLHRQEAGAGRALVVAVSTSRGERIFNSCNVTFMIFLSAWFIVPFVVVASTSVVGAAEAARRGGLVLIPETFYKSGEASGEYQVLLWNAVGDGDYMVLLNFNSPTPANRELIQNLKFRQALSLAINRDDFNRVINTGLAIPQQMTLLPTSRFYKEEYARSWAQYDLDKANQMLDELGLQWDANGEFRIGPDGKRISFLLEEGGERPIEAAELLAEYWKAVGIDMDIKLIDRELFHLHMEQNEGLDVHITKYGMMDGAFIARPDMFLPAQMCGRL